MIRSYSSLLFWLGLTIVTSILLYHTSDRVAALDKRMHKLNVEIEEEEKSLHILKAEWVYLSQPARIEAEAKRYLGMQPTASTRVAALDDMGLLLPIEGDASLRTQVRLARIDKIVTESRSASLAAAKQGRPHTEHDRILATVNAGRINDHMTLQHAATTSVSTDRIGALIGKLGLRP